MTKIELLNFKSRAILGNIRNMSLDCLERPRPRVQYIHFWRGIKKKLSEVLQDRELLDTGTAQILEGINKILQAWPKPQNTDSREISRKLLEYLQVPYEEHQCQQ